MKNVAVFENRNGVMTVEAVNGEVEFTIDHDHDRIVHWISRGEALLLAVMLIEKLSFERELIEMVLAENS